MKKALTTSAAAAMIVSLGLTGCGTRSSTAPSKSAGSSSITAKSAFPITLKDDTGHKVTVLKPPKRIASATEGTDEILSALVPKKDIVMVTQYAENKEYSNVTGLLQGIPEIQDADPERIIAANPDLVLMASYTSPSVVSQIKQANIPAYEFNDFNSIQDIEHNINVVGQLVGNETGAKNLVENMERQIQTVKNGVKNENKLSVLDYSSYGQAAGSSTTVNDIITDAGGTNAASKLNGWQKISDEEIVKMNPDVIIDASDDTGFAQKIMADRALQSVSAVKHHRVYMINAADLSSVSQYITNGVRDVAKVLYPHAHIGS